MTREQLDAIRARVDDGFPPPSSLDIALLLAEVERLTADPLPAAAWVREVERAAFARGAAAMREAAVCAVRDCWLDVPERVIRALPDPEDTP